MTLPFRPPCSSGSWTFTDIWWTIWLLPEPNSPYISVIAWVSIPPPSRVSSSGTRNDSFRTSFRASNMSLPVLNPPTSAASRAALIIFFAVDSEISDTSESSAGAAVAMLSTERYPASRSFSAVLGPTPGKSSISNGPSAISCNTPMAQQDVKDCHINPRTVRGESVGLRSRAFRKFVYSCEDITGTDLYRNDLFRNDAAAGKDPGHLQLRSDREVPLDQVPFLPVVDESAALSRQDGPPEYDGLRGILGHSDHTAPAYTQFDIPGTTGLCRGIINLDQIPRGEGNKGILPPEDHVQFITTIMDYHIPDPGRGAVPGSK